MPTSMLEDEHQEPFKAWQSNPGSEANAAILTHLAPTIQGAIKTHVGESNPLLYSKARRMTLDGLRSYDPGRGRLKAHLYNHLQGLKRVNRQQTAILKVPERVSLDRYNLDNAHKDLADQLGRDPSTDELADHTGFSAKRIAHVRSYNPAVAEGTLEASNPDQMVFGGTTGPGRRANPWHELVYGDLSPRDQVIMEHSIGFHNKPRLRNDAIADKLKVSPGLVSQRKNFIQSQLDREQDLSPFG